MHEQKVESTAPAALARLESCEALILSTPRASAVTALFWADCVIVVVIVVVVVDVVKMVEVGAISVVVDVISVAADDVSVVVVAAAVTVVVLIGYLLVQKTCAGSKEDKGWRSAWMPLVHFGSLESAQDTGRREMKAIREICIL